MPGEPFPESGVPPDQSAAFLRKLVEGFSPRAPYVREVEQLGIELTAQLDQGVRLEGVEFLAAQATAATLLLEAVAREDQAAMDQHVETLAKLAALSRDRVPSAAEIMGFTAATMAGNEKAGAALHAALTKERQATTWTRDSSFGELQAPRSNCLETVIAHCEDRGLTPEHWITTYAIDGMHRHLLYTRHLARLTSKGLSEVTPYFAQLEEEAVEGLATLPAEWSTRLVPGILPVLQRPHLRLAALHIYALATSVHPPEGFVRINELGRVFHYMVNDPVLSNPERVEAFGELLKSVDHSPGFTTWKLDLKLAQGASPQEAVAYLDELYSENLSNARVMGPLLSHNRDTELAYCAQDYAKKGDMAGAKVFLAAIGERDRLETAIATCLSHAVTPEQSALLKPDETTLMVSPDLAIQFRIAEADWDGDIDTLATIARDLSHRQPEERDAEMLGPLDSFLDKSTKKGGLAETLARNIMGMLGMLGTQSGGIRDVRIMQILDTVSKHNKEKGTVLAKELLATLRAQDDPKHNTALLRQLTHLLVQSGDAEEMRRVYELIEDSPNRKIDLLKLVNISACRPLPLESTLQMFMRSSW